VAAAAMPAAAWRWTLQRHGGGGAPPAWRRWGDDGRQRSDNGRDLQREDGQGERRQRERRKGEAWQRRRESSPEMGTASAGSLPASFSDSAQKSLAVFAIWGGSGKEEVRSYICWGHWSQFMPPTGTVDPLVPVGGMNRDQ
jgi:hypothetical protein